MTITDRTRAHETIIVIKVLVQGTIISVISVYARQCGLGDSQKHNRYDSLINVIKLQGKEIV